jgi:glycosyltransferase involved in cell wall biosynthesis
MQLFRRVFDLPEAIGFLTEDEQALVNRLFPRTLSKRSAVIGSGVTVEQDADRPATSARRAPFLLYLGRIDAKKGVGDLATHFVRWKARHGGETFQGRDGTFRGDALELVLAGAGDTSILPARADVVSEGFVSEERKRALLASTEALMMPSPFESLSLVMLEAWTMGRPVLVNRRCAVTLAHTERSKGGLAYRDEHEFDAALTELLSDAKGARAMGERGGRYVADNYTWERVEDRVLQLVRSVRP